MSDVVFDDDGRDGGCALLVAGACAAKRLHGRGGVAGSSSRSPGSTTRWPVTITIWAPVETLLPDGMCHWRL